MNMQTQSRLPRLLLVEDDATSQAYLRTVLEALPAHVEVAATLAAALHAGGDVQHDLWLIDANLPDGSGAQLLARLRARHPHVPALAHTADGSDEIRQGLLQAGFAQVLAKPLARAELLAAVRGQLGPVAATEVVVVGADADDTAASAPDWDDVAALGALNGQQAHVAALRSLFLSELARDRTHIASALQRHDTPTLRDHLHRLQASCGFVGASRLGQAVRQLRQAPEADSARRQFDAAVSALLQP